MQRTASELLSGGRAALALFVAVLALVEQPPTAHANVPSRDMCVSLAATTGLNANNVILKLRARLPAGFVLRTGCLNPALEPAPWQIHLATGAPGRLDLDLRGPGLLEQRQLQVPELGREEIEQLVVVTIAEAVRDAFASLDTSAVPLTTDVAATTPEPMVVSPPPAAVPAAPINDESTQSMAMGISSRARLPAKELVAHADLAFAYQRAAWGAEARLGCDWPRHFEQRLGTLDAWEFEGALGPSWNRGSWQLVPALVMRVARLDLHAGAASSRRWRTDLGAALDLSLDVWQPPWGRLALRLHTGVYPTGARVEVGGDPTLKQALAEAGLGMQWLSAPMSF